MSPSFSAKREIAETKKEKVEDGGEGGQVDNRNETKRKAKMKKGGMFTTKIGWKSDQRTNFC